MLTERKLLSTDWQTICWALHWLHGGGRPQDSGVWRNLYVPSHFRSPTRKGEDRRGLG